MAKPSMPETIPWSVAWGLAVLLLTVNVSALPEQQLLREAAQVVQGKGESRWKAEGHDTASDQNSNRAGRFRSGQYLGFQRAQHGVPGYGVRRLVILGSTSLPAGEFYEVNVARPRKGAPPALNMSELVPGGFGGYSSCFMRAQSFPEPMSLLYERRHAPPTSLPGGVNRAFYRWPGNVTRTDFDAVPYSQRGPLCGHCTNFVSYQIINGSLYRGHEQDAYPDMTPHRQRAEDMLLVVLYLWDLPDMDFKLHFGDGCPTDLAAFSWNVCRHKPKGGFTMPSTTAWVAALGPIQTQVYYACLAHRYPINERRPVAFWRGTNTDNNLVDRFTDVNYRNCTRIQLHMDFKPTDKTRIDAQISALILADPEVKQAVGALSPRVPMEDFNNAAVVLDLDGNGWSDRWVKIIHFNTLMLKQASNNTAFFEHLHTGPAVGFFKNDLSDLQAVVDRALEVWDNNPQILQARTASRQGFAAAMLNQVAIAEAMGHALMVYHSKLTWQAAADPTYKLVPFTNVCNIGMTCLPQQLCANIRLHKAAE